MDLQADLAAPCTPEALFAWVDDLARYPQWLDIVTRARPDGDGAWAVDLRAKVGPLARTKRLRMIRSTCEPPHRVVFERAELDGRQHSPWELDVEVRAAEAGSNLVMHLRYGGGLFGPVIERVLGDEIERAKPRLLALVAAPA